MIRRLTLPGIVLATFFFLAAPVLIVVVASFNSGAVLSFPPTGFTTHWYERINPLFLRAVYVSLIVGLSTALLSTMFGVPAALALARGRYRGRDVLNSLCLSPLMVPALVTGVALYQFSLAIWDVTGIGLGGTIAGLVLGHMTFGIPFVIRAVIAGHARFDRSLEEAARNLGATPLQTFRRVTLPVLQPSIVSGGIFAFLMSLDDVPIALFVGGGDATTLPVRIFTTVEFDFGGDIMAVASLIVGVSVALMLALDRLVGLEQFFGGRH
ncbi:MAG: ABC transporter permease [Alphaproteobacteria bacterium]|nr:ABC transporter permease [Alphaproteobacteria bacterium]